MPKAVAPKAQTKDEKAEIQYMDPYAKVPLTHVSSLSGSSSMRKISMEEVAKHTEENDCWFVVNGKVYDSTAYNAEHPGGAESILMVSGEDATEDFEAIHSPKAWKLLEKFQIGVVGHEKTHSSPALVKLPQAVKFATDYVALNPRKKLTVPVLENRVVSNDGTNDVIFLKLGLPSPNHVLGLPPGKHFMVYAKCEVRKGIMYFV